MTEGTKPRKPGDWCPHLCALRERQGLRTPELPPECLRFLLGRVLSTFVCLILSLSSTNVIMPYSLSAPGGTAKQLYEVAPEHPFGAPAQPGPVEPPRTSFGGFSNLADFKAPSSATVGESQDSVVVRVGAPRSSMGSSFGRLPPRQSGAGSRRRVWAGEETFCEELWMVLRSFCSSWF